jgi:two-component sensor histidine kinase
VVVLLAISALASSQFAEVERAEQDRLNAVASELAQLRARLAALDAVGRELTPSQLEGALGEVFSQLDEAKLLASDALEARLATAKIEVQRPVRLYWVLPQSAA